MKRLENKKIRVHPSAIKLLTETTWNYAHAVLWQQFPFSKEEIELAKIYIKEFYESIPARKFQQLAIQYFKITVSTSVLQHNSLPAFRNLTGQHQLCGSIVQRLNVFARPKQNITAC